MIQTNGRDRDDRENGGRDARGDHPGWERTIDEPLHSGPAREERVSPESDRGQVIAVNRPANDFRDHIVGGAEPDRAEPEEKKIIREPPGHGRLHHTLDRDNEKHDLSGAIDPWEPEERAEQIPLRYVNVVA